MDEAKLTLPEAEADANFGTNVALFGQRLAVSAQCSTTRPDNGGTERPCAGDAYIFERDLQASASGGGWSKVASLMPSDGQAWDGFGHGLSADGDRIVVGSVRQNNNHGKLYVYSRLPDGAWGNEQMINPMPDVEGSLRWGRKVAMDNDGSRIISGGWGVPIDGTARGAAFVWKREPSTNSWIQACELFDPDGLDGDAAGYFVSIGGNYAISGAYTKRVGNAEQAGVGYIFDVEECAPALVERGTSKRRANGTSWQ